MGEDLEPVVSRDSGGRDAGGLGEANRKRSRCRYRNDHRRTDHSGLLNHLDGNTAGEQDRAAAGIEPGPSQRPGELVERVVSADILANELQARPLLPKGRGMDGSRRTMERLMAPHVVDRSADGGAV